MKSNNQKTLKMKTIKHKYMLLMLLFITAGSFAQTSKLKNSYKTSANVIVELDSRYTNIIVENWDRNEVAVEAYLNGNSGNKKATKELEFLFSSMHQSSGCHLGNIQDFAYFFMIVAFH